MTVATHVYLTRDQGFSKTTIPLCSSLSLCTATQPGEGCPSAGSPPSHLEVLPPAVLLWEHHREQVGTSEPGACTLGSAFLVSGPGRQRLWRRVSLQEAEGLQKPRGPPVWNRLSEPHVQPRAPRQSHRGIRRRLTGNPNEKQTSGPRPRWLLTLFLQSLFLL